VRKFFITVCASGGGGNFQALINAQKKIGFEINCLIVDRECGAISRANDAKIPVKHVRYLNPSFGDNLNDSIPVDTNLVVLAGFMPILPKSVCKKWSGKIINTHPSLLPKFGGIGMFGVRVQEAVMNSGEKNAGCTIHFVNEKIDGGKIILQKSIEVNYSETPWQLGSRIFMEENILIVEAVKLLRSKSLLGDSL
jgi:phosphoribosylglycinamide formyltransferase-1